jgi:SAM-dependent methyltransferase
VDLGPPACPLCAAPGQHRYAIVGERTYIRCPVCLLTYLDPAQCPTSAEEEAEYRLHDNRPDDPGYRRFLSRAVDPLCDRLAEKGITSAHGLDFGCGPGPALSIMMAERGHVFVDYDPIFRTDSIPLHLLHDSFDAIACTEVVEHFHQPGRSFALLNRLLRPGGTLVIMTDVLYPDIKFAEWHYIREISHVSFYAPETLHWIARRFGWSMTAPSPRVRIFEKS